jgi:hypothetical protein
LLGEEGRGGGWKARGKGEEREGEGKHTSTAIWKNIRGCPSRPARVAAVKAVTDLFKKFKNFNVRGKKIQKKHRSPVKKNPKKLLKNLTNKSRTEIP